MNMTNSQNSRVNQNETLLFEHGEQPVEIKTKGGVTRKFKLIEHTGEDLDHYIEQTSSVFDSALETLQQQQKIIRYNYNRDPGQPRQIVDPNTLRKIKDEVAEHSSDLLASLLHDADGNGPVTGEWIRKNTTRRMRERILLAQNELDGVETVQDQSFLIEKAALIAALSVETQNLVQEEEISRERLTQEFPVLQESFMVDQSQAHVHVDDLPCDEDGSPLP